MAKFDLKRGNVKQSDKDLWQLRRTLEDNRSKIDGACADRMSALASIRQLTNNAEPSTGHAAQFESAVAHSRTSTTQETATRHTRPRLR